MVSEGGHMFRTLGPIYRDMYSWEKARKAALKAFESTRGNMMKVAEQHVGKILKVT